LALNCCDEQEEAGMSYILASFSLLCGALYKRRFAATTMQPLMRR
jgi:hypothetical protein